MLSALFALCFAHSFNIAEGSIRAEFSEGLWLIIHGEKQFEVQEDESVEIYGDSGENTITIYADPLHNLTVAFALVDIEHQLYSEEDIISVYGNGTVIFRLLYDMSVYAGQGTAIYFDTNVSLYIVSVDFDSKRLDCGSEGAGAAIGGKGRLTLYNLLIDAYTANYSAAIGGIYNKGNPKLIHIQECFITAQAGSNDGMTLGAAVGGGGNPDDTELNIIINISHVEADVYSNSIAAAVGSGGCMNEHYNGGFGKIIIIESYVKAFVSTKDVSRKKTNFVVFGSGAGIGGGSYATTDSTAIKLFKQSGYIFINESAISAHGNDVYSENLIAGSGIGFGGFPNQNNDQITLKIYSSRVKAFGGCSHSDSSTASAGIGGGIKNLINLLVIGSEITSVAGSQPNKSKQIVSSIGPAGYSTKWFHNSQIEFKNTVLYIYQISQDSCAHGITTSNLILDNITMIMNVTGEDLNEILSTELTLPTICITYPNSDITSIEINNSMLIPVKDVGFRNFIVSLPAPGYYKVTVYTDKIKNVLFNSNEMLFYAPDSTQIYEFSNINVKPDKHRKKMLSQNAKIIIGVTIAVTVVFIAIVVAVVVIFVKRKKSKTTMTDKITADILNA